MRRRAGLDVILIDLQSTVIGTFDSTEIKSEYVIRADRDSVNYT